jgi:PGAP1-like protein
MGAAQVDPGVGLLDALSLLSEVAEDLVVHTVRDTHLAWSRRMHAGIGGMATVPRLVHLGTAGAVYGVIGAGLRVGALGLDVGARTGAGPRLDGAPARRVLSAVNGLIGDRLAEDRPRLALPMALRDNGHDLRVEHADLAQAYPDASWRIVVFLPGLCEDESAWERDAGRHHATYPADVAAAGWSALRVRANTGLAVHANGALLDDLLTKVVAAWPVPVQRLVLVGHSMGGLVARAACVGSGPWVRLVSDLITLGTPHLGAELAGWARHGSAGLSRLPETAAFARILDRRSVGILDLERGLDTDAAPAPAHVRMRLVSGSLARFRFFGDLLVRRSSAAGATPDGGRMFPDADVLHVPGADHFDLLNHDDVRAAILGWLAEEPPRTA